jgi:dTDP-4-dehydrorhamnose reductase
MKHPPKECHITAFVFGSNGMLGKYLTKYLSSYFEVVPITRNEIDLNDDFAKITNKYNFKESDVIINAAGIIKQRNYLQEELIKVNSLFPQFLSKLNCNIIHITTDCVFSGKSGFYDEDFPHDCIDDYGKSKSLGENSNLTIIRTSIIGEEVENKKSLLEWVRSNKNKTINGYLNHFWNGVTCLELSKQICNIIQTNSYWKGIRHYHSPDIVSKYELVSYINEIYKLGINIIPKMEKYCDRSLSSKYESPIKTTIKDQILELKEYKLKSQISNKDKLKNFPTVNFISIEESEDRRKALYENFQKNGIKVEQVIPNIFKRFSSGDELIQSSNSNLLFTHNDQKVDLEFKIQEIEKYYPSYMGVITSHLKAIKNWYETTDEEYAIFCEDDLGFDTVEYWNFTWQDFFENLPPNWECIQLSVFRDSEIFYTFWTPDIHFRSRCWCDWSCLCYLITRKRAKQLLDNYYIEGIFYFDYKGIDIYDRQEFALNPYVENIIYTFFGHDEIFSFPLFCPNEQFETTVWEKDKPEIEMKGSSFDKIMKWWKTKGNEKSLEQLFINQ